MHFFVCYAKCTQKRARHVMNDKEPKNLRLKTARIGLAVTDWLGGLCIVALAAVNIGKHAGLL